MVKLSLKKVITNACLHNDEMETILIEIKHIVSSRPLIHQSKDNNTNALVPLHLLYSHNSAKLVLGYRAVTLNNMNELQNPQKYIDTLMRKLWNKFYDEYMILLWETNFWGHP